MIITLYIGIAIGIVGWMQLMMFEPVAPTCPDAWYPWFVTFVIACLGTAQQFCLVSALKVGCHIRFNNSIF